MTRAKRRILVYTLVGLSFLVGWACVSGPTSADIRIDTGDLRYRYFGVPLRYDPMPEPRRSALIKLSRGSQVLRPKWYRCAVFPLPTTNNSHFMCRSFYGQAFLWIEQDPEIARVVAEDVARYIIETNAERSLPESYDCLSFRILEEDEQGRRRISASWRDDHDVQVYLKSKGLTP